ncbi:MAG: hypothetical protein C0596_04985 [Marinilabiliales bacterium]|mgnify:CR=1 FL=1|nr:MAG: hypothetical protein C0596_04985 [Marinilabiliales bacterium]
MKLLKISLSISILIGLILTISCETFYNYDLSVRGLDSLPATKACVEKYIPHSVDAKQGYQEYEIQLIVNDLDNYSDEIEDSLRADMVLVDSIFVLQFTIAAWDPYDEITTFDFEKYYFQD